MKNESAKPDESGRRSLNRWDQDADAVRYWCQHLRALADLMAAGEPMAFLQSYAGTGDEQVESFTVQVSRWHLADAFVDVERRTQAGDPDYAIRTTQKPPSRPPQRKHH